MRPTVRAAVIVCLLALGSQARAQTVPADGDAWPEAAPPTQPAPLTAAPDEPQPTAVPEPQPPPPVTVPAPVPIPTPAVHEHEHWYGWQTLAVDGAVLVLAVVGASVSDGDQGGAALATLATSGYVLGGPIVHFAHERVLVGFASMGLRVFTPFVFALVGYGVEDCSSGSELCGLGGLLIGGSLGILTAIAVDAAVLAREDVPDQESALPHLRLALARDGAGIVASGSF